jgi:hypothetical protein
MKIDREEVLQQVLDYAKTQCSSGSQYAYAFGMISVLLDESQLEVLKKVAR